MKNSVNIWATFMPLIVLFFFFGCDFEEGSQQESHDYVNLGLPSGTLWATCNVGAKTMTDYGDFFAWGETETKTIFDWETYKFFDDSTFTKYMTGDFLTVLEPADDVAAVSWGSDWSVPTQEQWEELQRYTSKYWVEQNGIKGLRCVADNGNSVFFPASGRAENDGVVGVRSIGEYWSSSLYPYTFFTDKSWSFGFNTTSNSLSKQSRYNGFTVRPVRSSNLK